MHNNAKNLPSLPMTIKWHIVCHVAEGDTSLEWGGESAKSVYFLWPRTWLGVLAHSACFPVAPRPQAVPSVVRKPASVQVLERGVQQCSAN